MKTNATLSFLAALLLSCATGINAQNAASGAVFATPGQPQASWLSAAPAASGAVPAAKPAAKQAACVPSAKTAPQNAYRLNGDRPRPAVDRLRNPAPKAKLPAGIDTPMATVVGNGLGGPDQTPAYKLNKATGKYEMVAPISQKEIEEFRRKNGAQKVTVIDVEGVEHGSVNQDQLVDLSKHPEKVEPYRPMHVDESAVEERLAHIPPGKNNIQDGSLANTMPNGLVRDAQGLTTDPDSPPTAGSVSFRDSTLNVDPGPPDTDMSVGPNHVITDYNTFYSVWDKNGVLVPGSGNVSFRSLFTGLSQCGGTANLSDPQVSYDDQNDRFVFGMLAYTASSSFICLAVTKTNSPVSGGFWNAQIPTPGTDLSDYPHIGIGEDAIFIGTNNFNSAGTTFTGAMITAVNKANLYAGVAPASRQSLIGTNAWRPQPAERRGFNQGQYPPAGTPHFIVVENNGSGVGEVWRWPQPTFSSNATMWATPVGWTFSGNPAEPNSATYTNLAIDSLGSGFMDAELRWPKLWTARSGINATFDSIQWAEIDVSGGSPVLGNNGLYSVASNHLWVPDVTVDRLNNMAVGMTRASAVGPVPVSAAITGREAGITPANQLETIANSKLGTGVFTGVTQGTHYRWGDYQGVTIDPNGCDIWFTGPYSRAPTAPNTSTWVQKFKFPSCSVASALLINKFTYTCSDTMTVTVQDNTAFSAAYASAQVAITTGTDTENIAAASWVCDTACAGGNGTQWHASIPVSGSAGANQDGTVNFNQPASITVLYTDTHPLHTNQSRTANGTCTATIADGGFLINGGCDNTTGTQAPLTSPSELYNPYMDNGEFSGYTFGFINNSDRDLTNATATLAASGAGAGNVTIYNPTVALGAVPRGALTGAVFNISVSGAAGLTPVTLTLNVTSPNDGFTTPVPLVQTQYLQTSDTIVRQRQCYLHNSQDMTDSVATTNWIKGTAAALNPWRFVNSGTVNSEDINKPGYFGTTCGSAALGVLMVGNVGTNTAATNFANNADSTMVANFQPALRGNGPNGQPYNWVWVAHSWYFATEVIGNTTGAWGSLYEPNWNNAVAPTADQAGSFPISFAYYYDSIFDPDASLAQTIWQWDTTNAGTPEDPTTFPPDQFALTFDAATVRGAATATSYFAFGHEHLDTDATANRDIAFDNDQLIYDEYYRTAQVGNSCSGVQGGQVTFDSYSYDQCPAAMKLSVMDSNIVGTTLTVTVTSAGTGDSETVTLTGAAPYFSGYLNISTGSGTQPNDGMLWVTALDAGGNPDTLTASYADIAPAGTRTATAFANCTGGDVVYVAFANDNTLAAGGDNDTYADSNETVTTNITIKNNLLSSLTNARVRITSNDPNIDCISDGTALYGTVAPGATVTNPGGDKFTFHVKNTLTCSNFLFPPTARFNVLITADGFSGSSSPQAFNMPLDLDVIAPTPFTYTENFDTNPAARGWTHGNVAGDSPTCVLPADQWHYETTVKDGATGGSMGMGAAGLANAGANVYSDQEASALYSPTLPGGAAVSLSFKQYISGEAGYDGGDLEVSKNGGAWTKMPPANVTPAYGAAVNGGFCQQFAAEQLWITVGTTAIFAASTGAISTGAGVTAADTFQMRWRFGSDVSGKPAGANAGWAVDTISVTGMTQNYNCESTNPAGTGTCPAAAHTKPAPDGVNIPGTPIKASKSGSNIAVTWDKTTCIAPDYHIVWGTIGNYAALSGGACAVGTSGSWTGNIPGSSWYVVVGAYDLEYSSFGKNSAGAEEAFTGMNVVCAATPVQYTSATCP